jgi:hypothetical protein
MIFRSLRLFTIVIFFLSCENLINPRSDHTFEKISYPIVSETNSNIRIAENGSVTFLSNVAELVGAFMVYNCRNKSWPVQTDIKFDRYNPYWVAGEFIPSFDDSTERNTPYNLIQLYHSIFFRYQPQHVGNHSYNFFQFAFVPDWQSWMWLTANTERGAFHFDAKDSLRYVIAMDHDTNKMMFWIKNLNNGEIAYAESNYHDYPYRPPTNLKVPIREIFIGSGSHGYYYGEEFLERGRETFWGKINETIIANGKITIDEANKWLDFGRIQVPSGSIKFDLHNISRETLIPLTNWEIESGIELMFGGESQLWSGVRQTLHVKAESISNVVSKIICENDLRKRYLSFAARTDHVNSFSFNINVKDDSGIEKWLLFSPKYLKFSIRTDSVKIPIKMEYRIWKNFAFDMLNYYNRSNSIISKSLTVEQIKISGQCAIADILLSNNDQFYIVKYPTTK